MGISPALFAAAVMDVNMPGVSGLQATRAIKEAAPDVGVIGLSIHSDEAIRQAMMEAGAKAYHSKDGPSEELINSIRIVAGRVAAHAEG